MATAGPKGQHWDCGQQWKNVGPCHWTQYCMLDSDRGTELWTFVVTGH
jgi:hypothetical protein